MVSIIMGSDSDLPVMKLAAEFLDKMEVSYEIKIVSAHRTPDRLFEYSKKARENGIKVIIAGAGGAAHLPGMVASLTSVPVIGVPIKTSTLSGVDSLYSIVQMPGGIPVATVSINGGLNAGILASEILGVFDSSLYKRLSDYKKSLETMVIEKSDKLETEGYQIYLSN